MSDDLEELHAWSARLESDVADLALTVQQLREELADAVAGGSVKAQRPTAAEVEAFVADTLGVLYARAVTNTWRWCSRWSEHPEAVARAEALLLGWREAEASGRWPAWWRDCDAAMAALTDPAGTFAACTPDRHYPPPQLPSELLPAHPDNEESHR
jgi:hypothetical protein